MTGFVFDSRRSPPTEIRDLAWNTLVRSGVKTFGLKTLTAFFCEVYSRLVFAGCFFGIYVSATLIAHLFEGIHIRGR